LERPYACLPFGVVGNRHKYPKPSHPFGPRVHCERPRRRATEQCNEFSPLGVDCHVWPSVGSWPCNGHVSFRRKQTEAAEMGED
jgi:hypothetical protein